MPIITCSGKRSGKVASQITDKGYCSTKKLHYYGAKLHGIAFHRKGELPLPEYFCLTKSSEHDLNAVREILPRLNGRAIIGDKAYSNKELNESLQEKQGMPKEDKLEEMLDNYTKEIEGLKIEMEAV